MKCDTNSVDVNAPGYRDLWVRCYRAAQLSEELLRDGRVSEAIEVLGMVTRMPADSVRKCDTDNEPRSIDRDVRIDSDDVILFRGIRYVREEPP